MADLLQGDLDTTNVPSFDLSKAIERVKRTHAERADLVYDLKITKMGRLEALADELEPVINEIPDDIDMFEFAVTNGDTPRLWVDMISFVKMREDGNEFEFVKDTRAGRSILGHSPDRSRMAYMVTAYVAERIIDREREIDGDWITYKTRIEARKQIEQHPEFEAEPEIMEPEVMETSARHDSGLRTVFVCIFLLFSILAGVLLFGNFEPILAQLAG